MHDDTLHYRFADALQLTMGHLTMTDRRLLFYKDRDDPHIQPRQVLNYAAMTKMKCHYLGGRMRLVKVTMSDGETWHIVLNRKSVKTMKKLVRRRYPQPERPVPSRSPRPELARR